MSIANEWFVDYYHQLIVHAQLLVFYTGAGGFTIGETVTWSAGAQSAIVVAEDTTANRLFLVYNTNTPTGTITGASSGATATYGSSSVLNKATINYDTGTGGWSPGDEIVIGGTVNAYVVSDDTVNDVLVVKYADGTISDNDTITGGAGGELVNGTPVIGKMTYTVRQLYSFLQDTFDELDQLDDTVPMSAQTPTEFTMINGWFIDDNSTQYLSGGAISTSGWNGEISLFTFDTSPAYVNVTPDQIGGEVGYDGGTPSDTGTLLHYNNTTQQWWVRTTATFSNTATDIDIDDGGTDNGQLITASQTGETLYANIYTLGTIQTTPNPKTYVFQNGESLSEWWGRGDSEAHIDVLIKVSEVDTEIDGAAITVFVRHYADLYDHFPIDLSSGGRNAVPLATQADLNNNETGEQILSVTSAASFTVGNFVRGVSSGTSGEILALDTAATPDTITVGNVVGTVVFTDAETINETIDGTSNGDTGVSTALTAPHKANAVAGYNDVGVYFVNVSFAYTSGSTEPTLYETVSDQSGASGILVDYTLTGGTWGGGTAAGVFTIANWNSVNWTASDDLDGTTSGNNFASVSGTPTQTIVSSIDKAFEQGVAYPYNVIVDCAGRTMAEVYEWFKYVTREDANSAAPAAFNHIIMYRVNDGETAVIEEDGEEYISAKTTYTPVKASPFGTFAGGKLFGARGVWVENMDNADRQNFQLIDANNDTRVPPNFITITVNSVVSGDKVSVFRTSSGTTINKAQFTSAANNNSGDADFIVEQAIPSDTPSSGYIRVVDVSDTSINRETRYAYSDWATASPGPGPGTFTLSGAMTLDRTYTQTSDTAYVPYYDEVSADTSVSVTVIYYTNQTVLTRVRQYDDITPSNSILPFQITGTVTTSGYTVAAIRTTDTIVTAY